MNIHGCQLHPKVAINVVKQLKNDSFRQGLYVSNFVHTAWQKHNQFVIAKETTRSNGIYVFAFDDSLMMAKLVRD